MIKKLTLIALLLIGGSQIKAQDGWVKQKIDDQVTVSFPVLPKQINESSVGIKDQDGLTFIVTSLNLAKLMNIPVEKFTTDVATQAFADEFLGGLAPSMPSFTFPNGIKINTLKGKTCYQLIGKDDKSKSTLHMNIVFVNGISYSMATIIPEGKPEKNKDIFLTNFTLAK